MTTDELLDAAQQFWDNVSDIDAGYGQRRARLLLYAQQAYDEIRNEWEWQWEVAEDTGTITGGTNTLALPDDYEEFGTGGGFFVSNNLTPADGDYREVEERSVQEVSKLLRIVPNPSQLPSVFAIYGGNLNFPAATSTIAYKLVYSLAPLTLADGSSQDLTLPARYHHTVLLPALVSRMQEAKGDVRENWERRYQKGLALMKRRERPRKTVTQQVPAMADLYQC